MFWGNKGIATPGWPKIIPTSFVCEMKAILRNFDMKWREFQWKSLSKCFTTRFRGGRLGALPAFLGRHFGENSCFFGKKDIVTPRWPEIIPRSFWCEINAIRRDFDAVWCEFQRKSLRKCTTTRFRRGRLGALPAFLRVDFERK